MTARHVPRLTRSDAQLLAALTERQGRPADLRALIGDYDWLNRSIPTFDELRFGLPRLVAHGLASVDATGRTFRATPRAVALRRSIRARTLGDVVAAMTEAVHAPPWPEPDVEDRSLGGLPGLEPAELEAAVTAHARSIEPYLTALRATIAIARLVTRPLVAARRAGRRLTRRSG